MSRRMGPKSPHSPMATLVPMNPQNEAASQLFDQFCAANTFQAITSTFHQMCDLLELRPSQHRVFYHQLKTRLTSWKAQSLWSKLDKRASHREYKKGTTCANTRALVIGCGPVGLRTAIELALLGTKAVIVEKRDRFSRNNVLHLWPFLIHDLKALGAKKFFGKFCAGSIDHISIRTLQCILLKVALLVGVEVHGGVGFECLAEPDDTGSESYGWRVKVEPPDHAVSEYEFDVLVGADGKRNTLPGFKRKEFRGKLAIAITANFINKNSQLEARVQEISGVAYIFNQKFFKDLNKDTGIDLENIVYYKDETHYFVMTAKKHSLLKKRVLRKDYDDPAKLLARPNVDQDELMNYACEAADFSTNHLMPNLDFAHNHYGQPDVAMFDFTSMFAAEHASRVIEKKGKKLLICLVGDSLLEPFWPTGSGCARGFLSALDTAWMVRNYSSGKMTPLEVIAERESIYQLLSQTTPENLSKNFSHYTVDPMSRYPNINKNFFKPFQVRHQYEGVDEKQLDEIVQMSEEKSKRYEWIRDSHYLLKWFQKQLETYRNLIKVHDLTTSWRSGLAMCALIHKYRPELVDVHVLDVNKVAENNQKAFDIAEKEFGIDAVMTGQEMAQTEIPDKLAMATYLSQFYEYFRKESIRPAKIAKTPEGYVIPKVTHLGGTRSPSNRLALLNKISQRIRQRRESSSSGTEQNKKGRQSDDDDSSKDDDDIDKENDSLKRQRRPNISYGMARKKMKEEEESELPPPNAFLDNYRKLEGVDACRESKFEETKKQIKEEQISAAVGVRGKNKVSELAKDLARQFSGGSQTPAEPKKQVSELAKDLARQFSGGSQTPAEPKKPAPKAPKPLIMGHAAPAEVCYFCKDRVYLVERNYAEGLYFHRGCLKCDYCAAGLRIGGYSYKKTVDGEAKFYCFQHHGMKRITTRARKRSFGDKDLVKKLLPVLSPEKGPVPGGGAKATSPGTPQQRLLKQPTPSHLTPLSAKDTIDGDKNKTPERIEFEPESEYEESELEQTAHNLSSTMLDLSDDDLEDSDSDSEEEECWLDEAELSDADISWAELARNYSKQMKKKLRRDDNNEEISDSDSDTPTIGGSDADYETDTETEDYEEVRQARRARRINIPGLSLSPPTKDFSSMSPQKDAKSPASEEIQQKRNSFFHTVSEPVRIDPWAFLGMTKKKEEDIRPQVLQKVEDKEEQDDYNQEIHETPSEEEVEDIIDEEVVDVISLSDNEEENPPDNGGMEAETDEQNLNVDNEVLKEDDVVYVYDECDIMQSESNRTPSDPNIFDMSPMELQQRRDERYKRMNKSDEVVGSIAGVKQLDISLVSIEDGGSTSDNTSLMEGELTTPDQDIFESQQMEEIAALPLEMEAFLEEMASLPQDLTPEKLHLPIFADETLALDSNLSDVKTEQIGLNSKDVDVYTVEDLLKYGLMKNSSQSDSKTISSSETDIVEPNNSGQRVSKSSMEDIQKQSDIVEANASSQMVSKSSMEDIHKQSDIVEPNASSQMVSKSSMEDIQKQSDIVEANASSQMVSKSSMEEIYKQSDIVQKELSCVQKQDKYAFYNSPTEPVRIDAKSFLKLKDIDFKDGSSDSSNSAQKSVHSSQSDYSEKLTPKSQLSDTGQHIAGSSVPDMLDIADSSVDLREDFRSDVLLNNTESAEVDVNCDIDFETVNRNVLETESECRDADKEEIVIDANTETKSRVADKEEMVIDANIVELEDTLALVCDNNAQINDTQCDNIFDIVNENMKQFSDETILQDETLLSMKAEMMSAKNSEIVEGDISPLVGVGMIKKASPDGVADMGEMVIDANIVELDDTLSLVCDNNAQINDTQCEDIFDIVNENMKQFSDETILQDETLLSMKAEMMSAKNIEIVEIDISPNLGDGMIKKASTDGVADMGEMVKDANIVELDDTLSLVCDNNAQINDTQCEDIFDIVNENMKQFSDETILQDETLLSMKSEMTSVTNSEIVESNILPRVADGIIKKSSPDGKSSSDESDTKFDTIKRKRAVNKQPVKQVSYEDANSQTIISANEETPEIERHNNENKSVNEDSMKPSTSFYSEGNGSRISSIPDSAPLASLDLDMEMTSGHDSDYEEIHMPSEQVKNEDNVFIPLQTEEDNLMALEQPTSILAVKIETGAEIGELRKSEIEAAAIKRIDDLLVSFEQSKETKIDFPMEENQMSDFERSDNISKWLQETNVISPIAEKQPFEVEENQKQSKWDQADDSSLPYVSFGNEDSSQLDSFGTPNAAFIGSPSQYEEALENSQHENSYAINNEDELVRETDIIQDIGDVDILKDIGLDRDFVSGGNNSYTIDSMSVSKSAPEQLSMSLHLVECDNLNNSSIIEFKVSDDEGQKSFSVDEKFVVTRDRKKKKLKTSHSESSNFTISTPSESIASTSSVPELHSTHPSSLALTASTTGDSFSALKGPAFKLTAEDISSSFDNDLALTYKKESSLSLDNLTNENNVTNYSANNELSSLDFIVDNTFNNNLESDKTEVESTSELSDSQVTKTFISSAQNYDKNSNINVNNVSKSAPTSVHPVKKLTGSINSLPSPTTEIGSLGKFFESPKHVNSFGSVKEDGSFYFTPNGSGLELMDTNENKSFNAPKSPAPTVKSDSMLLDDRRNEIRKSDTRERSESPVNMLIDAKRKFFCETPKPVRIDHFKLFQKDLKGAAASSDSNNLQKGWKSLDSPTATTISAGVPSSNIVSGDCDDRFFTPATSVKNKPAQNGTDVEHEGFKKPQDVRRKLDTDGNSRSGLSVARELTTEERRQLFNERRDKARQEARERAKLMSDEELGIQKFTPTKATTKSVTSDSESGKKASTPGGGKSGQDKTSASRPNSAKSYFKQSSRESIESGGRKTDSSDPSPSSDRKKPKGSKGLSVFKSQKSSPKMDKKQKSKKDEEEKENKEVDVLKKEKKKSLFSKLLSSKSQDKKDKTAKNSPLSPPLNRSQEKEQTPTSSREKKHPGVIFRNRRSKSADRSHKTKSQYSEEDPQSKRESLYRELAPMFQHVLGRPDGEHPVSAVKAKIETVAPPPVKAPYTVLEAPRAACEDFDTESEFGDTTSVRSFQGSSTVSGLSEEELAKLIKKQQKAAKKRQREQELRRLHMAQEIQRQLEEVEVKQREIEQRGVIIERALRSEGPDAKRDESELMQDWFNIVHEKNVLVRYESELMVHARELELEDRQSRLEQQLRDRMSIDENESVGSGGGYGSYLGSPEARLEEEQRILQELVSVVEQRDALVALLEEDRQREREQEQGLKAIMTAKGFQLSPITYANRMRLPSLSDIHGANK